MLLGIATAVLSGRAYAEEPARVEPVPLGGKLGGQTGDKYYGVYIPTRYGGSLSIKATAGTIEALVGPDGKARENGGEIGFNQHGWYTFRVVKADKPFDVETEFVQVGESTRKPWNFYYWPTKGDSVHEPWAGGNGRVDTPQPVGDDLQVVGYGSSIAPGQDIVLPGPNGLLETPPSPGDDSTWFPNLYDDLTWRGADGTWYVTPSPLLKYDQLFGQSARSWEAANSQNQDIQRWPGHCLGGAVSSIMLNEPNPAPGSGLSKDELKALWAELGENHYNHRIGDNANNIPAGPPRPGADATDPFVPRFHAMLERHIRGQKKALLANLRGFPPTGKPNEVWNHGVGKFTTKYHSIPGQNPRMVRLEVELVGNSGSNLNEQDPKPRTNTYEYTLVYNVNGEVDEFTPGTSDWIAVGGDALYAPLNVMQVIDSRWQGHNPMVSESNIRALDLANGGGDGRFLAQAPPQWRPVGTYEAGRVQMASGGNGRLFGIFGNNNNNNNNAGGTNVPTAPRRGGLFRGIFGR
jgi:hypothetical protein